MADKKWIKQGEPLNNPIFIWYRAQETGRLMSAICHDYISQGDLNALVERHELVNHKVFPMGLAQCEFIWPAPKD